MNPLFAAIRNLLLATSFAVFVANSQAQTADWPGYLRTIDHTSYNQLASAITPGNAANLSVQWSFVDPPPTMDGQPAAGFNSSPTVSSGVVYIGSNTGEFYAIDENTGAVLWQQLLGYTTPLTCRAGKGITSTATVAPDPVSGTPMVYVGGGDGYLYALDAATGNIVWRQFVIDVGTTENSGYLYGSPLVFNKTISIGLSSSCDNPLVRGGLKSFDQHTGKPLRVYWTTPTGTVGASVWTSAASDGRSIWITVGNGDAGDSFSIVRLSSALKFTSKWTVPDTAGTDLDWGSSPTLFQAKINGVRTQMIGANEKNGTFYALKAADLASGPVWSRIVGSQGDFFNFGICTAAAAWDSTHKRLFVGSNQTVINSQTFSGAVRALEPATGGVIWETGVTAGPVMGSPTLNGAGVLAAGTYSLPAPTQNKVYLLDASDGAILTSFDEMSQVFAQPVFADTHLFIATTGGLLTSFAPPTGSARRVEGRALSRPCF